MSVRCQHATFRATGVSARPQFRQMPALAEFLAWSRPQEEKPVMSRLAIALVVALAATGANAQDTKSGQSDKLPAEPSKKLARLPADALLRHR